MVDKRKSSYRIKFPYDPSEKVYISDYGPSMTIQSEAEACDIHQILERHQMTGQLTHVNSYEGRYGDFSTFPNDYQHALNVVIEAETSFQELPARMRDAFNNDPMEFFRAVHDPEQQDRLIKLGVFTEREAPPLAPGGASVPPGATQPAKPASTTSQTPEGSSTGS